MKRANLVRSIAVASCLVAGSLSAQASEITIIDDGIPKSLTGASGSADRGRDVIVNRKAGNCLACHKISVITDQPFHGEIGPPLDGAASRWSEAQLRLIVVDSKKVFDGTMMPAFHRSADLNRVMEKFQGKTILSAEEVEDVVAFLKTLNEE